MMWKGEGGSQPYFLSVPSTPPTPRWKEAILASTWYGLDTEVPVTPTGALARGAILAERRGSCSQGRRADHMVQEQLSIPARPHRGLWHQQDPR